ncbi:MAG: hypothetical protein ACLFVD_01760 [Dehalococcoidia bacterium]
MPAQRPPWYIDRENNLGLFKLNVCIDDEAFRQDVHDFFAAAAQDQHPQLTSVAAG